MDKRLLDLLCCPLSRQPLSLLEPAGLDALNRAIEQGSVLRHDGSRQESVIASALITRDRKRIYRIDDSIPVLLVDASISTAQVTDFPA